MLTSLCVTVDRGHWKYLGLSSFCSLKYFETSVILQDSFPQEGFPNMQPNIHAFEYMLDLISEVPRGIEYLTVYLRLTGNDYLNIISMGYNWNRFMTLAHSFQSVKMVDVIIISDSKEFGDIADECHRVLRSAFRPYLPQKKRIIRSSCHLGDYDRYIRDPD